MLKTHELIGADLDWYVAKIEKMPVKIVNGQCIYVGPVDTWAKPGTLKGILVGQPYNPSTRYGIGGIIMERERIRVIPWDRKPGEPMHGQWYAGIYLPTTDPRVLTPMTCNGPTFLIAAMRAYVLTKIGPEVPEIVDDYEVQKFIP